MAWSRKAKRARKAPRCGVPTRAHLNHAGGPCARPAGHPGAHSSPSAYALKGRRNAELDVLKTYGVTAEEYTAIKEIQGGRCFLCRRASGKAKRLAVDHSHSHHDDPKQACRECVRALLCSPCNTHLGWVEWVTIERIQEMLTHPPAQEVLHGREVGQE